MTQIVSARVDEKLKKEMERHADINWSEVLRQAIENRLALEEQLRKPIDKARALRAMHDMDRLREKLSTGKWSGTEEIRKWRDLRH